MFPPHFRQKRTPIHIDPRSMSQRDWSPNAELFMSLHRRQPMKLCAYVTYALPCIAIQSQCSLMKPCQMYFSNHIALRGMADSIEWRSPSCREFWNSKDRQQTETSFHDTHYAGKTTYMEGAAVDGSSQLGRYTCCSYVGIILICSVMPVPHS